MKYPYNGQQCIVQDESIGTVSKCYINWEGIYKIEVYVPAKGQLVDYDPKDVEPIEVKTENLRVTNAKLRYEASDWPAKIERWHMLRRENKSGAEVPEVVKEDKAPIINPGHVRRITRR